MNRLEHSMYHSVLRVTTMVCAFVLIFESGLLIESTKELSQNTHSYLANAVGVGASVQPTELNLYTAQLTAREQELNQREAALQEREIAVELSTGGGDSDTATYLLASILFILLLLILLNYTLDFLRAKEQREVQAV